MLPWGWVIQRSGLLCRVFQVCPELHFIRCMLTSCNKHHKASPLTVSLNRRYNLWWGISPVKDMKGPSVLHKTKIPTQEISQTQTLSLVLQKGILALLHRTGHFLKCNPSHKRRFLLGYLRESSRASKFLFLQYTINIDLWFTASRCIWTADVGPGPCRYHWCVGLGTKHSLNERKLDDYQSKYPVIEEFAFHGLSQCFSQLFKTILSGQKQTLEGLKNRWNWSLIGELLGVRWEGGICVSVPMAWLSFSATSLPLKTRFPIKLCCHSCRDPWKIDFRNYTEIFILVMKDQGPYLLVTCYGPFYSLISTSFGENLRANCTHY